MPPGKYNPWPKHLPPEQQADVLGGLGELKRLNLPNSAEALAKATGGTTFPFTKEKALEEAIQKFGQELHSQYVVSFAPEAPAAGITALKSRWCEAGSSPCVRVRDTGRQPTNNFSRFAASNTGSPNCV